MTGISALGEPYQAHHEWAFVPREYVVVDHNTTATTADEGRSKLMFTH